MIDLEEEFTLLMNAAREKIAVKLEAGELTQLEADRLLRAVNRPIDVYDDAVYDSADPPYERGNAWEASGGYRCW